MNKLPAQHVNGLIDGMAVLQALTMSTEPISGKAVAEKLNLSPVRVNRILKTLAFQGLAYRTRSRRYSVGPGIHLLAAQSMTASGLINRVTGHLKSLAEYNHTVALGMLWRNQVSYLYHHSAQSEIHEGIARFKPYPAAQSSIGLALLAEKSDQEVADIYKGESTLPFENISQLLNKLREIRKNTYAAVKKEHISLAVTVGVPPYAAIAISGFKDQCEEKKYYKLLRHIIDQINQEDKNGKNNS